VGVELLCRFFPPHHVPFFSILHFLFNFFPATTSFFFRSKFFWSSFLSFLESICLKNPSSYFLISSHPVYVSSSVFLRLLSELVLFSVFSKCGVRYSVLLRFSFYFSKEAHFCALLNHIKFIKLFKS
jgi:hypothetical protein